LEAATAAQRSAPRPKNLAGFWQSKATFSSAAAWAALWRAAARGAREAGGLVVGVLPGEKMEANPHLCIAIATGMGHARNAIIVKSADAVIALPGEHGTLSEMALALKMKKRVISLHSWEIPGTIKAETPKEAVRLLD